MYSPTALNRFLGCEHRTYLDMLERRGTLTGERRPANLTVMLERGDAFEAEVLEQMRAEGRRVVSIKRTGTRDERAQRTVEAMREGVDVIHQGCFAIGESVGYPDFLVRIEEPSSLGDWSYEVHDAKLGAHPRPAYIFQLLFYTEALEQLQGHPPPRMHLILGNGERPGFGPAEFEAYARRIEAAFRERRAELEADASPAYPYPVADCDYCPWWAHCRDRRRADDHISLVANLQRRQGLLIEEHGIHSVAELAHTDEATAIDGLSQDTLLALRAQADLQLRSRGLTTPLHELLQPEYERGLGRLPAASPGDVYFDFEGDPNWGEGGLEYLFGSVFVDGAGDPEYLPLWAETREHEKDALERWIDWITERLDRDPGLHVYHYNAYEPTALKALVARHATREAELDVLLRRRVFVDLYGVTRQTIRAGVESYGLKGIERLYDFQRAPELHDAVGSLVRWQQFLDTGDHDLLHQIGLYNRDDCLSTRALCAWLRDRRPEAEAEFGVVIDELAPAPPHELSEAALAREARTEALRPALLAGLPDDETQDVPDQRARRLAFTLTGYHVHEAKPAWWAHFDRQTKTAAQLTHEDGDAMGGLTETSRTQVKRSFHHELTFPSQEHKIGPGKATDALAGTQVNVVDVDEARGVVTISRGVGSTQPLPVVLGPGTPYNVDHQIDAVFELAENVAARGLQRSGIGRDLLLARAPRLKPGTPGLHDGPVDLDELTAQVKGLDDSVLVIQGPPGAGKTYTGARLALALMRSGKTVGVFATGHKAIDNFCAAVDEAADETGDEFRGWRRDGDYESDRIHDAKDLDDSDGPVRLHAATAWWWSRPEARGSVDVLLVDEAGMVSLADAVAVGRGARSMVLLGDPQQLAHVSQGSHPFGSGASVLQHLLGDADTIAPDRGVLLDVSWRMHPDLCDFVSRTMYDGRLRAQAQCAAQRIDSAGLSGTGLRMFKVAHVGNRGRSAQEAQVIADQIDVLLRSGRFTDRDGAVRPLTLDDILVVAPYNAQVRCLTQALPPGARVGTVDKFQGQQAPVVFFSMATSSADDANRGMGFLFSRNRLNVAISRAQALAVIVCSPQLLRARCTTVEDMRLVNMLCLAADEASHGSVAAEPLAAIIT